MGNVKFCTKAFAWSMGLLKTLHIQNVHFHTTLNILQKCSVQHNLHICIDTIFKHILKVGQAERDTNTTISTLKIHARKHAAHKLQKAHVQTHTSNPRLAFIHKRSHSHPHTYIIEIFRTRTQRAWSQCLIAPAIIRGENQQF